MHVSNELQPSAINHSLLLYMRSERPFGTDPEMAGYSPEKSAPYKHYGQSRTSGPWGSFGIILVVVVVTIGLTLVDCRIEFFSMGCAAAHQSIASGTVLPIASMRGCIASVYELSL